MKVVHFDKVILQRYPFFISFYLSTKSYSQLPHCFFTNPFPPTTISQRDKVHISRFGNLFLSSETCNFLCFLFLSFPLFLRLEAIVTASDFSSLSVLLIQIEFQIHVRDRAFYGSEFAFLHDSPSFFIESSHMHFHVDTILWTLAWI